MRGKFISLEGGEGAGKSTQVRRLAAALEERGVHVVVTREPGGSEGAEAIRALLMKGEIARWSPHAEALLFAAARADHVERLIRPAVAAGSWVICDRYIDSTRAYQGIGGIDDDRRQAMLVQRHAQRAPDQPAAKDDDICAFHAKRLRARRAVGQCARLNHIVTPDLFRGPPCRLREARGSIGERCRPVAPGTSAGVTK